MIFKFSEEREDTNQFLDTQLKLKNLGYTLNKEVLASKLGYEVDDLNEYSDTQSTNSPIRN